MDTIGSRLKAAMARRDYRVADLVARKVISRAGAYQWLNDTVKRDKVRDETVKKICKTLGIERDWLLDGREPMLSAPKSPPAGDDGDWPDVTGYAQAVGLGEGVEAEEYAQTHKLKFRSSSLARKGLSHESLAVVYGSGDSMQPRIRSGDAILFDTSDTRPRDESLFVIQAHGIAGGEYSVKRCRHFGDDVYFDALNPAGDHQWRKPRRIDDKRHPITIIGRVRWIGSWED